MPKLDGRPSPMTLRDRAPESLGGDPGQASCLTYPNALVIRAVSAPLSLRARLTLQPADVVGGARRSALGRKV